MEANPIIPQRPVGTQVYGPARPRDAVPVTRHGGGLLLARVRGVEVRLDWSLAIIFALVTVNLAGGLWLLLIGWFLNGAALAGFEQQRLKHSLEDVPVRRLMRTRLVREHVLAQDQPAYPVEEHGLLVGLVTFEDVRRVPQPAWARTPIRDVMKPA